MLRTDIQGLRAVAVSLVVVYHLFPSSLTGGFVGRRRLLRHLRVPDHAAPDAEAAVGRPRPGEVLGPADPAAAARLAAGADHDPGAVPAGRPGDPVGATPPSRRGPRRSTSSTGCWPATRSTTWPPRTRRSPVQHFWSLSVEEQFYFVWPILILGMVLLAAPAAAGTATSPSSAGSRSLVAASLGYSVYETAQQPGGGVLRHARPGCGSSASAACSPWWSPCASVAACRPLLPDPAARRARLGRARRDRLDRASTYTGRTPVPRLAGAAARPRHRRSSSAPPPR